MAEYHGQIQLALAGFYEVLTAEGKTFRARARGNFRKKSLKPLVGDWVTFSAETATEGYILAIDERKNSIVRPPVANVDQVIIVTAVKMPDWSSNLLDRQLVALEEKSIEPVIYFTKTDLLNSEEKKMFAMIDRKSTRLNSSHVSISYAVFCLKKKKRTKDKKQPLRIIIHNKTIELQTVDLD